MSVSVRRIDDPHSQPLEVLVLFAQLTETIRTQHANIQSQFREATGLAVDPVINQWCALDACLLALADAHKHWMAYQRQSPEGSHES